MANYLFVVNKAKEYRPGVGKVFNERAACAGTQIQNCRKATNSARGVNANKVNKASFNGIIKTNTTLHDLQFFRDFTSI